MKNILPKKDPLFVTNYQKNSENLKINYLNGKYSIVPYSVENERKILETMKNQVKRATNHRDKYMSNYGFNKRIAIMNSIYSLVVLSHSLIHSRKYINIIPSLLIGASSIYFMCDAFKYNSLADEIEKYEYFIENEKNINEYLLSMYKEMYGKDADINEANKLTINDLDNYTSEDLKRFVRSNKAANEL